MAVQQEQWTKPPINCFLGGGAGQRKHAILRAWILDWVSRGEGRRGSQCNQRGSRQCSFQAGLLRDGLDSGVHQVGRGAKINVRL